MNKEIAYTIVNNHEWDSKLPPEVKAEWVAALRSGNYAQARNALRKEKEVTEDEVTYSHCCLSVLAETFPKEWHRLPDGRFEYQDEEGLHASEEYLPPNDWLSFQDMEFLGSMNDGSGPFSVFDPVTNVRERYFFSFEEIADIIEAKL